MPGISSLLARGRMRKFFLPAVCSLLAMVSGTAAAGQSCEERSPDAAAVQRALGLAHEAQQRLDASGANVALIARAGQNLSRFGVRYSHLGFVWRDHPKGAWRVVHELNQCGTASSDIFDNGLGNFFLDDLWKMEAVILIPGASTQQQLATKAKRPGVCARARRTCFCALSVWLREYASRRCRCYAARP